MNFKAIYQRLSLRERILLIAFIWVVLVIVLGYGMKWTSYNRSEWSRVNMLLDAQQELFEQRPVVEAQLDEVLLRFNREKTFSAAKLTERVDELARSIGLVFITGDADPEHGLTVSLHTLPGSITRKKISDILQFVELLDKEYPYITLDNLRLTAESGNPEFLTARFVIKSFELK